MKKIIITSLVLLMIGINSCEQFLEEDPFNTIDPSTLFVDERGALAAVNATYKMMARNQDYYGRDFLYVTEVPTEMTTSGNEATDRRAVLDNWKWDANHRYLAPVWVEAYAVINAANGVIENVSNINMDETLKNRIIGEAKFLRAFNYFVLVRLWGGVPIRTEQIKGATEQLQIPRSTAQQVYELIISDLEDAAKTIPENYDAYSGPNVGRVTLGAVRTLLAKVYLQRGATASVQQTGDFQKSLDYSQLVIQQNKYQLEENFRDIFDVETENGPEVIFDIQHVGLPDLGGDLSQHLVPRNSGIGRRSSGNIHTEVPFFDEYSSDDQRLGGFILEYVRNEDTIRYNADNFENDGYVLPGPGFFKMAEFDGTIGGNAEERPNKVLLRYADVLLMYAEAANEVNNGPTTEAYNFVNMVRQRAGIGPLKENLPYQAFKDSVFIQRRKEFVVEFHGWFDGLRNWDFMTDRVIRNVQIRQQKTNNGEWPAGSYTAPIDFTTEDIKNNIKFRLFPIPQRIMDANPLLDQNPGWEGQ